MVTEGCCPFLVLSRLLPNSQGLPLGLWSIAEGQHGVGGGGLPFPSYAHPLLDIPPRLPYTTRPQTLGERGRAWDAMLVERVYSGRLAWGSYVDSPRQ